MTKGQLETGMLVQCRNESIYLLINETLIGNYGFIDLNNYAYNLTYGFSEKKSEWDIIKVTRVLEKYEPLEKHWIKYMKSDAIWDRKEDVNDHKTDPHSRTEQFDIELDRWVERDQE